MNTAIGSVMATSRVRLASVGSVAHASSTPTAPSETADRKPLHASATWSVADGNVSKLPSR